MHVIPTESHGFRTTVEIIDYLFPIQKRYAFLDVKDGVGYLKNSLSDTGIRIPTSGVEVRCLDDQAISRQIPWHENTFVRKLFAVREHYNS